MDFYESARFNPSGTKTTTVGKTRAIRSGETRSFEET